MEPWMQIDPYAWTALAAYLGTVIVVAGVMSVRWMAGRSGKWSALHSAMSAAGKPREEVTYFDTDPSWELEIAEFVDAIRDGAAIQHGTSEDALQAMKLVFAIYDGDA